MIDCTLHEDHASPSLAGAERKALYRNASATLDDLREAVATLDELTRTARRVLGGTNPVTTGIEDNLRRARAALRARETPPPTRREFAQGWLDGPP